MSKLKNTVQGLRETLAGRGDVLARDLSDIDSPDAKIAALEKALLNTLKTNDAKVLSYPIAEDVLKARGMIRVTDLAERHGLNTRRLQRIFLDEIGMPAKVLARIVRFNHAMNLIQRNPDIDLLSLTYECEYADQAHFTRNFREMFGITPAEFKARMQAAREKFRQNKPDVVFLQDQF